MDLNSQKLRIFLNYIGIGIITFGVLVFVRSAIDFPILTSTVFATLGSLFGIFRWWYLSKKNKTKQAFFKTLVQDYSFSFFSMFEDYENRFTSFYEDLDIPILMISGDKDELFEVQKLEDAYSMIHTKNKELVILENETHTSIIWASGVPINNWLIQQKK